MNFLGCVYRFSCKEYKDHKKTCHSIREGDFLKCKLFRIKENKQSV